MPFLQEPCLTFGIEPIRSHAGSYDQGHPQSCGLLHMASYQFASDFLLAGGHLKYKLVMHLQDHAGRKTALLERARDPDHGQLDQVRRRALQRGVGGGALTEGADIEVAILELRDVAPSSEQGLDITALPPLGDGSIDPTPPAGAAGEVPLNQC